MRKTEFKFSIRLLLCCGAAFLFFSCSDNTPSFVTLQAKGDDDGQTPAETDTGDLDAPDTQGETDSDADGDTDGDADTDRDTAYADTETDLDLPTDTDDDIKTETGCGRLPAFIGHQYVAITSGGIDRKFYLSIPDDYDHNTPAPLYVGIHGGNYDGMRMRDYLGLETVAKPGEIFVYPDALLREWEGWEAVGWQNGPATDWFGGTEDLAFIADMLDYLEKRLCIDQDRIFITGHSWGAEFTNAVACYRGDRFRGFVSVAANTPYYLPVNSGPPCVGTVDAWIMHGKADPNFPVSVGEQVLDFWLKQNGCTPSTPKAYPISYGALWDDQCFEYKNCEQRTLYCSYTGSAGHQPPTNYYAPETMEFFRSLL